VGTLVEASLFNAGIDLQMEAMVSYFTGGFRNERLTRQRELATWFHPAPYGIYEAADGFIAISTIDPKKLADVLSSERLREIASIDRYKHRDEYAQAVAQEVKKHRRNELAGMLDEAGLWNSIVQDYDDLAVDPQAIHNEVFREINVKGGKATVINHPNRYDGHVPEIRRFAFDLGEDTVEIARSLGYSEGEIDELLRSGAIIASDKLQHKNN
jgi:crotonobetainyl-CoA:carnitine CoA-transferase CaiB-like acyl-CoA transferase